MTYDILNLPDDPEQLKAIIVSLHDKMSVELQRLTRIIEKFFNKSSEKIAKDDSQTVEPVQSCTHFWQVPTGTA